MPIYEYQCSKCGNIEEAIQKFSDKPLSKCRHCSGRLHRLISQSTFHLKGSGWYVTDYANKSKNSSPKPQSTDSAQADSAKPATSESASTGSGS
ncbi:MAG: zinc ribbon domain-containing protein [Desulfobacterales bacterium]|nr:zinc ribbon domain-containing protein [Desulfobacterales bacterium]